MNLAIIGCGRIQPEEHARAFGRVAGVRLAMAVDIDAGQARSFAARHVIEYWAQDYRDALANPGIDAVVLCLPPFLNRDIVLDAARMRKHILCRNRSP